MAVSNGPASATMQFDLQIPNDSIWLAKHVYLQAFGFAPGANSLGVIVSNGLGYTIGNY